jgi:alkylated DNA repair dioxygenase AlkB
VSLFEPEPSAVTPDVLYSGGYFLRYPLEEFIAELPLAQRQAVMYGKRVQVPRLECWFGVRSYTFGGRTEHPLPWTPMAARLRDDLNEIAKDDAARRSEAFQPFDSCFCNLYRSGDDTIPWHADDDDWIGPVIASVSFGSRRRFVMRHNKTGAKVEYGLGAGDLLLMRAGVQREWQHCVPRTKQRTGPRLNLTFRQTVQAAEVSRRAVKP